MLLDLAKPRNAPGASPVQPFLQNYLLATSKDFVKKIAQGSPQAHLAGLAGLAIFGFLGKPADLLMLYIYKIPKR